MDLFTVILSHKIAQDDVLMSFPIEVCFELLSPLWGNSNIFSGWFCSWTVTKLTVTTAGLDLDNVSSCTSLLPKPIVGHHGTKTFSKIMGLSGLFYFFKDCLIPLLEMDFMIQVLFMTVQAMDCWQLHSLKHFPNFFQCAYLVFLSASFFIIFKNVVSDVVLWVNKQLLGLTLLVPPLHPHHKEQHQHCRTKVRSCYGGSLISIVARVTIQRELLIHQCLSCHLYWQWWGFIVKHIRDLSYKNPRAPHMCFSPVHFLWTWTYVY